MFKIQHQTIVILNKLKMEVGNQGVPDLVDFQHSQSFLINSCCIFFFGRDRELFRIVK